MNIKNITYVMVEENNCGAYVNPEIPSELAEMILDWKAKPEILKQMGLNSRQLAETTYDESILTKKFAGIIKGLDLKK